MLTTTATWVLALAMLTQASGVTRKQTWKKVAPAGGDFQVRMPAVPETLTNEVPVPNIGKIKNNVVSLGTKERAYIVMFADYPPNEKFDVPAALRGGRDGALKDFPGANLVEDKEIELNGVPGLEVKAELPAGGGNPVGIYHLRMYMVKNRVYQVVTIGPKSEQDAPEVARFFKSFKLLGDHAETVENGAPGAGNDDAGDIGGWKRFAPENGGFTAMFPGKPSGVTSQSGPLGAAKKSQYSLVSGGINFIVVYNSRLPDPTFDIPKELEKARDTSMKVLNVTETIDDREISLDGVPGREFAVRVPAKAGRPESVYRNRMFGKPDGLYQVVVIAPLDSADAPEVKRFLDSFKLIKVQNPPGVPRVRGPRPPVIRRPGGLRRPLR